MPELYNRIKGSLYGFAIGDAMGATTEFLTKSQIKYPVTNIIGGGWLYLPAGNVTDDTEMMIEIAHALIDDRDDFLEASLTNLVKWHQNCPVDVGNQTNKMLTIAERHIRATALEVCKFARDPYALGNGSLIRALFPILAFDNLQTATRYAKLQGQLTHNNESCDDVITRYAAVIDAILQDNTPRYLAVVLLDPTGHVENTFLNAKYHALAPHNINSFESCIIEAVNNGGDADSIAAVAGSISGALHGYNNIPKRWLTQLSPKVCKKLDKLAQAAYEMRIKDAGNSL